ncbi:MAG: sigma-70 family RNA polymerase sigma factor [Candidatus Glassbacteria bacterium]
MNQDRELVERILGGEKDRFGVLVEKYQRQLYRFLRGMSLDHDEAADVLQNAFIRAYEKLDTLRGGERFRVWIYSIAANQARNYLRDKARVIPLTGDGLPELEEDREAEVDREKLGELVCRALDGLTGEQKMVVVMRIYNEMPFKEVAESCGMTVSKAKVTYHRAMKTLSRWLTPAADRLGFSSQELPK